MKKVKLFFIGKITFTIIAAIYFSNLAHAGILYPYKCEDINCYKTSLGEINKRSSGYFLSDEKITKVNNFKQTIDNKLNNYINFYGENKIDINDFKQGTGSTFTKKLTMRELIDLDSFKIEKRVGGFFGIGTTTSTQEYKDGKDYLFQNFEETINQFHSQGKFPVGNKENKLSDIIENITRYDESKKMFLVKNYCTENTCEESKYVAMPYDYQKVLYLLNGKIEPNRNFTDKTFKVSDDYSISNYALKAGGSVDFTFKFEDFLDGSHDKTTYKYILSYKYANESGIHTFLEEEISVDKDFKLSSPNIEDEIIGDILKLKVKKRNVKQIEVAVSEGLSLTKAGKVLFLFSVENLTTGEKFENQLINKTPVEIFANDNLYFGDISVITPLGESFSKESNDEGFNRENTFSVSLNLKDEYGNIYYDYDQGYEISLSDGTSKNIELATSTSKEYAQKITGIKTSEYSPYNVNFKFRVNDYGYHVFNGFNIKVREKKDSSKYTEKYISILDGVPSSFYHKDGNLEQKMNIHIKEPDISDFDVKCTNKNIVLKATCVSDNFSGCNSGADQSKIFTTNGEKGELVIEDYAYNVRSYQYNIDHIDKIAPTITFKKGSQELKGNNYNFYASTDFSINIKETTTQSCLPELDTSYTLKINDIIVDEGKKDTLEFDINLGKYLQKKGTHKVEFITKDVYGNTSKKLINFNIVPSMEGIKQSVLSVSSTGDKIADNNDYYIYTIVLKDKYGNTINNKALKLVEHNCNEYTSCLEIDNKIGDGQSGKSLIVFDEKSESLSDGKISFKLKSLAPGEFTQRFNFVLPEWNEKYENTEKLIEFNQIVFGDNSFKKPFYGKLSASKNIEDNWSALPEIGTKLEYKLKVLGGEGLPSNLGINLTDFKNSIKTIDTTNSLVQQKSNISGLDSKEAKFSASINTSTTATKLVDPGIKISDDLDLTPIKISYKLGGEDISYYLANNEEPLGRGVISLQSNDNSFLGVKVIGGIQGAGKSEFTGQEANISNLYNSEQRTQIRKNAYSFVKNMKSGDVVDGVKYVKGDYKLSSGENFETLVIVDGNLILDKDFNLILDKDFNASNTTLKGIIVLQDGYDVEKDFSGKGNIYITPNVTKINAIIYADGGIISADQAGKPYLVDSIERTSKLNKQLILNGSVFTRNTIGGGILAGDNYVLPGGKKLTSSDDNFNKAMMYDLNYVRRGNDGCDKNGNGICDDNGEYRDPFVIKYDSRIQVSPPKLFVK